MSDNLYIFPERTNYVPYEKTVHIHKAPTDDSIRLYNELKEKAEKSIIDAFEIKNTMMSCAVAVNKKMEYYETFEVRFKLSLNGEVIHEKFSFQKTYVRDEVIQQVIKKTSDIIAVRLLETLSSDALGVIVGVW